MYGQLAYLAARHQVTLATFIDHGEMGAVDALRATGIDVHSVARCRPHGIELWKRRSRDTTGWLRGGRPLRALQFFDTQMQQLLNRLLSSGQFDLLQVEDNAMGNYCYPSQIPAVFTEHEVRPARSDSESAGSTRWIDKPLVKAEGRRWEEYQRAVWRSFDRIQAFTPRDAHAIKSIAPDVADRVRINPFGFDIGKPPDPEREDSGTIAFLGGFGHAPNVDAALWLARDIMPPLRELRPGIRLTIVGSNPTKAIGALAGDDITVTGRVPAVESFLERAAVVLAPLRTGGGMRVKVLHAMALGRPVVTTPVGAEGLAVPGSDLPLVVAKNAAEIAHATATLLGSVDMRRSIGIRAQLYVREHFSWAAYGRRLEQIYAELKPAQFRDRRDLSSTGLSAADNQAVLP
jgi:glycosyltransferase involved in cell wall biosynthesis